MSSIGLMFMFFLNGILILLWKEKSRVQWAIHSQQSFQFLAALICEHSFFMHFCFLIDCNWADWFQLVSLNFYCIYNRVMLIGERIRNKERYPISLEQHATLNFLWWNKLYEYLEQPEFLNQVGSIISGIRPLLLTHVGARPL